MMHKLWWLISAISCFRVLAPKVEDTKTYLFVVISTFAFRGEDTKTRNILADMTKLKHAKGRKFHCLSFRVGGGKSFVSAPIVCRVFASKREGRNNENTADFRVVVISTRNAKVEVTTMTLFRVSPCGRHTYAELFQV
jgi:hypothetical protein